MSATNDPVSNFFGIAVSIARAHAISRQNRRGISSTHRRKSSPAKAARYSINPFAWIVRLAVAPFAHELVELGIASFRQHHPNGRQEVALALARREPPAPEPEDAPRIGSGRYCELDRAVKRRHAHFPAKHRFIERDGKLETQISALAFEQRMGSDGDRDQEVAGTPTSAGCTLPFQTDLLAVGETGRNLHLDFTPGRQLHALLGAV